MKTLIFATFLSLILVVSMPISAQVSVKDSVTQIQPATAPQLQTTIKTELAANQILTAPPVEKVSFFKKLWNGAKSRGIDILIGLITMFFAKNPILKVIKNIAGKGAIVTEVSSDILAKAHVFLEDVDQSIKDDGSVDQNSLKQAIEAGKTVSVATKEGYKVIFQPDKTVTTIPAA